MRAKFFGLTLVAALAGALLSGCSDEAKVAEESTLGRNTSLMVNAAAAGVMNISTITWVENCHLVDPGMGTYADAIMRLAATAGTRTENKFSDSTCTTQISTNNLDLNVTTDGNKTTVNWVDGSGTVAAAPAGLGATVSATKVTISGTDSAGPISIKTLLFVNDIVSPMQLLSGDRDSGAAVLDANGFPDNIHAFGSYAQ